MFEWDSGNWEHVREHGIEPAECERAMADSRQVPLPPRRVGGEMRWPIIGSTGERLLVVVYTMRGTGFRIVTAYPATRRHERAYGEANQ